MSRLVVVRHGNTFRNDETPRRAGSRTDMPLTDEGGHQARRLGVALEARGFRFARAFAGPLTRTRSTAELILSQVNRPTPLSIADALVEIDHGLDEGQPETAVTARVGAAALARWEAEGLPPPGWIVDRDARLAWWRALLARPPAGDTLLVTSNGSARFALLALSDCALPNTLKLRTGAFGVLRQRDGHSWIIDSWNDRPGELASGLPAWHR